MVLIVECGLCEVDFCLIEIVGDKFLMWFILGFFISDKNCFVYVESDLI